MAANKKKSLKVSSSTANKKKSLQVTAKSLKVSPFPPSTDKKKSLRVTAKSLKVSPSPPSTADKKKSLKVTAKSLKVSPSPIVVTKTRRIVESVPSSPEAESVPSSPEADRVKNMKKKLKSDSDIISILRKHKDLYQSSNVVIPGCVSQPLSEWIRRRQAPGALVGRLVFKEDNIVVDCSKRGLDTIVIPHLIDEISSYKIISSDALFILLVESADTYLMLAQNEFYNRFPCIIINSMKAIPDMGTRMFLKKLYTQLNLPVLALVHSTAEGLRSLYSYYQNEDDNTSIPDIKWLGTRPSDMTEHGIPRNCRLPMKQKDIKMVKDLLGYESVKKKPGWVYEFNLMLGYKQMVEIEAFAALGLEYLWEVYLPLMLQEQNWL